MSVLKQAIQRDPSLLGEDEFEREAPRAKQRAPRRSMQSFMNEKLKQMETNPVRDAILVQQETN